MSGINGWTRFERLNSDEPISTQALSNPTCFVVSCTLYVNMTNEVLVEKDDSGKVHHRYQITRESLAPIPETSNANNIGIMQRTLLLLSAIFMPAGYPNTVTPDYFEYQLYDSLQAFSSSIAGLLASRAVLEGVGVGDATASATGALLITIVQDAVSRLATILFAWRIGIVLEPEAKRYRLLADIFNDCAMIMDCLSPALPKPMRVFSLCLSGSLRALCGVAAGGAKAALSIHFSKTNNVGDLNAKDSSQETVIGLLGMLAGSVVVSRVTTREASWALLLTLIAVHLWTNYLAVCAVTLNTINRQRMTLLYSKFRASGVIESLEQIAKREHIFALGQALRDIDGSLLGHCHIGVNFQQLIVPSGSRSVPTASIPAHKLLELFKGDRYILQCHVYVASDKRFLICLHENADARDCLRAWIHAMEMAYMIRDAYTFSSSNDLLFNLLSKSYMKINEEIFPTLTQSLQMRQWNIDKTCILTRPAYRICISSRDNSVENRKEK